VIYFRSAGGIPYFARNPFMASNIGWGMAFISSSLKTCLPGT
jgi:hypothetical protein